MFKSQIATILVLLCSLFLARVTHAQNWQKYYGNGIYWYGECFESYDKGLYFINSSYDISSLYKFDVNGNVLWQRNIANSIDSIGISNMYPTMDGGAILSGYKARLVNGNYISNIYLIKLNACGQLDWCKVFAPQKSAGSLTKVIELANGDFVFYNSFGGNILDYQSWLFCTDSKGNNKWQTYNVINMENIYLDKNGFLIVSGFAYLPTIIPSNHPLPVFSLEKIDTNGNVVWWQPYSPEKGIEGNISSTCDLPDNGYFSTGGRYNNGKGAAYLLKSDGSGNVQWAKDFRDTTLDENPGSICKIDGNSYLISIMRNTPKNSWDDYNIEMVKVDGNGNVLKKALYPSSQYYLVSPQVHPTFDGKFLVSGHCNSIKGGNGSTYIYKLNADLGIDSFYNRSFVYDYKCTAGVAKTGTILLDHADTIHVVIPTYNAVKTDDAPVAKISFYPNPARGQVLVSGNGFDFGIVDLDIYNVVGQKISSAQFISNPDGQLQAEINISGLARGVYFVSLNRGQARCVEKLVVE